jgi:hypothetical protein
MLSLRGCVHGRQMSEPLEGQSIHPTLTLTMDAQYRRGSGDNHRSVRGVLSKCRHHPRMSANSDMSGTVHHRTRDPILRTQSYSWVVDHATTKIIRTVRHMTPREAGHCLRAAASG